MDEKPEPPAEDDSPGRPRTGAVARRTLTADLLDPRALLTRGEGDRLRGLLDALCDHLAADGLTGEIRAEIVGDERMSALHERYKDTPGTTDVLTFDLSGDPGALDVDIVICADEARRQARTRGHGPAEELALYIVHGILHCTGYDDHEDAGDLGAIAMHKREDEILSAIGAGVVYAAGEAESDAGTGGAS
ncbi:MAG: rRNA maturation RNase YbeY [Phycisphaerales bacterium JB058]